MSGRLGGIIGLCLLGCAVSFGALTARGQTTSSAPLPALVLVDNGEARATIVIPDDADSWTKMSAGWVKDYVAKVSGASLQVVPEGQAPTGALVSVGHTKLAQQAGLTTDNLKYDGCIMAVKGNILFLLGRDVAPVYPSETARPGTRREPWEYNILILSGNTTFAGIGAKGTCRAATFFLERICGVRWLVPTTEGTYIPRQTRIAVAGNLNEKFEPWMMYHSNRCLYGDPRTEPAAYANNYRVAVKLYTAGGHTYPRWVSAEAYGKDHPEYFTLIKGKRTSVGNHLCYTNPEVRQIILKNVQSAFDQGFDFIQLGQSDGYMPCECPDCRKFHNLSGAKDADGELAIEQPAEVLYDLAQWLSDQCLEKYPNKYLHLLVYGPTSEPPKRIKVLPKNIVLEFAGSASPELISRWEGRTVTGGTVYTPWHWVDYGIGIGVKMSYLEAAEKMKYFKAQRIIGMHSGGGQCWGLQGPMYYVMGKTMGDPDLDPQALLKEYCDGLYGSAAPAMMEFFERLHTVSDMAILFNPCLMSERFMLYYPPARLQALDDQLKKAEAAAVTEREKNWVKMTRDEFDYVRLVTRSLFFYRAWQLNPDKENRAQMADAVKEFDAYRKRIVNYDGQYELNWFPGHGELCNVLTRGQGGAEYASDWRDIKKKVNLNDLTGSEVGLGGCSISEPFTFDFKSKELRASFRIAYTKKAPVLDGKADEPGWRKAKPAVIKEGQTEIRGMYDDDNLYIAFLCTESKPTGPNGQDIVRDSPICFMDLVELFVDPENSIESRRYYHFLVGATANAIQDLREGFEGPSSQDTKWSSQGFRYGFNWDKDAKVWCVEMAVPFKDINAEAPKDGAVWLGNLAREGNGMHQWSKGGSWGFCNPKSFGMFIFEKP